MIGNQPKEESNQSPDDNSSKLIGSEIGKTNQSYCETSEQTVKISEQFEDYECPICMNIVDDRAYTDSCFHQFCRQCIEKWSHNHNKCPICRQTYSFILHKVVSNTEYERIPLSKSLNNSQTGMLLVDDNIGLLFTPLDSGVYMINTRQTPHGIRQNILFLASNQSFILENMGTNVTFVRPNQLDYVLSDLDQMEDVSHTRHQNTQVIPVIRETEQREDSHQHNNHNN